MNTLGFSLFEHEHGRLWIKSAKGHNEKRELNIVFEEATILQALFELHFAGTMDYCREPQKSTLPWISYHDFLRALHQAKTPDQSILEPFTLVQISKISVGSTGVYSWMEIVVLWLSQCDCLLLDPKPCNLLLLTSKAWRRLMRLTETLSMGSRHLGH